MPPHGPGFSGSSHSHSVEFPEDTWNLYTQIDINRTTSLNVTRPSDTPFIFKPFVRRLDEDAVISSDVDQEMILIINFVSPVNIRKLMIIGAGPHTNHHPKALKCYVNQTNFDFGSLTTTRPGQEFELSLNELGTVEIVTKVHIFTNVNSLVLYFPSNYGNLRNTLIKYIGMQGDHTHYRREAVDTVYELLCTGQEDVMSGEGHEHSHSHSHSHGHNNINMNHDHTF